MASSSFLLKNTPPTPHKELLAWVAQSAALTSPDEIYWCTGTTSEWERITTELVEAGTFVRLKKKQI